MRLADAIANTQTPRRTDLYRYYDRAGCLLYVGISKSAVARATQHEHTAGWWNEWVTMTRCCYPSRQEALAAEAEAIRTERPAHNVAGAPSPLIKLKGRA